MRELRGDDLFTILSILGKLDVKDDLIAAFDQGKQSSVQLPGAKLEKKKTKSELEVEKAQLDKEAEARGIRIVAAIVQRVLLNISVVKGDINSLLADLTSKTDQEIVKLGIVQYTGLVVGLFKKPEIREVFTLAASLLTEQAPETATETASI